MWDLKEREKERERCARKASLTAARPIRDTLRSRYFLKSFENAIFKFRATWVLARAARVSRVWNGWKSRSLRN